MFTKLLVATDGSGNALAAATLAAEIARRFHANSLLLNIFEAPYANADAMGVWSLAIDAETLKLCATRQKEVVAERTLPLFEAAGVTTRFLQEWGHPVERITHVAAQEQSDLIVLGSRGLNAFQEMTMGSVSNGVLHHARCPTLIVRGHAPDAAEGLQRILLATDGSECCASATRAAIALAHGFGTTLTVLNIYDPHPTLTERVACDDDPIGDVDPEVHAAHSLRRVQESVEEQARNAGVTCHFQQAEGHPAETVVTFATAHQTDLIVMGSRGIGAFSAPLLGSVSHAVAHHAPCPVLVAR